MPLELLITLVTLGIGVIGVVVYLWTVGASLLMSIEVHLLRAETHQLRIDYAKRIAELSGFDEDDGSVGVDVVEEAEGDDGPIASLGQQAVPVRSAA